MALRERISEFQHNAWCVWSKDVSKQEHISKTRLNRWETYWVPYNKLPDGIKEFDRILADKVLAVIRKRVDALKDDILNANPQFIDEDSVIGLIDKHFEVEKTCKEE